MIDFLYSLAIAVATFFFVCGIVFTAFEFRDGADGPACEVACGTKRVALCRKAYDSSWQERRPFALCVVEGSDAGVAVVEVRP